MSRYTENDLSVVDPIAYLQSNRSRYIPEHPSAQSAYLVSRLAYDALLLGAKEIQVGELDSWWYIASLTDWLGTEELEALRSLFYNITPFKEAGQNSMRSEVLLSAFVTNIVLLNSGAWHSIKGDGSPIDLETSKWTRAIAFQ